MASNKHNNTLEYYSELLDKQRFANGGTPNPSLLDKLKAIFTGVVAGNMQTNYPTAVQSYNATKAKDFGTAYHEAKSAGNRTFKYNGKLYNTGYKPDSNKTLAQNKQDELSEYGITSEYAKDKSPIMRNIHAGINPAAKYNGANDEKASLPQLVVNPAVRVMYSAITGKSYPGNDNLNKDVIDMKTSPYPDVKKDYNQAQDSWNLYMGYPQKNNTFSVSQTKPKGGTEPYYLSLNRTPNLDTTDQSNVISTTKSGNAILNNFNLGDYTVGKGNGYQSYYDKWDINPFGSGDMPFPQVGKPLNIYGRKYNK